MELEAKPSPVGEIKGFVREHLLPLNNVIVGGASLLAILDLLVPRTEAISRIVATAAGSVAALLVASIFFPKAVDRSLIALGYSSGPRPSSAKPAWRRPAWIMAIACLLCFAAVAAASVARADKGGILASAFPTLKTLQADMLSLHRDIASVQAGVDQANAKLDTLVDAEKDPQRALTSRGYPINSSGLIQAIKVGDAGAAALFAKIDLRVESVGVTSLLLHGDPWNAELAAALKPSMFQRADACAGPFYTDGIKEPVGERLSTYVRLCGKEKLSAYLANALSKPLPANAGSYLAGVRAIQERNQALLNSL